MTLFNVHIYREMKLAYGGIEAANAEEAATKAHDLPTEDADSIDDCDGATLAALVDVVGDEDYAQSRLIEFPPERSKQAESASHSTSDSPTTLREALDLWTSIIEENCPDDNHDNRDPIEPTNQTRARWAKRALAVFTARTFSGDHPDTMNRDDLKYAIADLICDLLHFAEQQGFDANKVVDAARGHYTIEVMDATA